MKRTLSPEELERWKQIALKYKSGQIKLQKQRASIQTLLADTNRALDAATERDSKAAGVALLRAQKKVMELAMRQMQVFDIDGSTYDPSPEVDSPAFEARGLELQLAGVEQDALVLAALKRIVTEDLPRLAEADPAEPLRAYPEAWLAERELLKHDADRRAGWEKFLDAYAALKPLLEGIAAGEQVEAGRERLAWLRTHVPALKGAQYRVHGALRHLPEGEAIFQTIPAYMMAQLELSGSGRKKRAGALTDRLLNVFKPPS